ncbi:MAG: aldo/keto reductase [Planctomycetota bacterium]
MITTTLGRTGLEVSVAGLGGGGHSRLGTSYGKDFDHAVGVVRRALELGVNLIDTATNYQTEPHVGRAIAEVPRDSVVISSKCGVTINQQLLTGDEYVAKLETSLKHLDTDYVDLYHLHGLKRAHYDHAVSEIVPALERAKQQGKLRHLAVSEEFISDPSHDMLKRALQDDFFDVVMVGHLLLNPSARRDVFPITQAKNIGTLGMFAVRRALTRPEALRELLDQLVANSEIDPELLDIGSANGPLGFLGDVVNAGYRFCAHEPGLDVVLFGTGNVEHLEMNLKSINEPPLPDEHLERLEKLFGHLNSVSGN